MAGCNKNKRLDIAVPGAEVQIQVYKDKSHLIKYNWKELPIVFQRQQKTVLL